MPPVLLATGSHRRDVGAFPEAVLLNMLAEEAPSDVEKGLDLIARPGLQPFAMVTGGRIRGVLRKSGVFGGDAIVVAGTNVYRVTSAGEVTELTGEIPGYGFVSMDSTAIAGESTARFANGTALYVLTETNTVTEEAFPDNAGVLAVATLASFWFAIRTDTQQVYSREPGASVWSALAFTSAEGEPDLLVGMAALGDTLVLFGEGTTEFHTLSGDDNPAIVPVPGLRWGKGCRSLASVAPLDNQLAFVGDDNIVYQLGPGGPKRISDHGLEEQIRNSASVDLRAWNATLDGHDLYILTLGPRGTWVRDAATQRWSRFRSRDHDHWRAHLGTAFGSQILAADSEGGTLWLVTPDRLTDDGTEIERYATGVIDLREGRGVVASIQALCSVGAGKPDGTGAAISLRTSKDNGRTWGAWRTTSLGAIGNYATRVIWRRLGQIVAPGLLLQVRVTDATTFRLSDLRYNV